MPGRVVTRSLLTAAALGGLVACETTAVPSSRPGQAGQPAPSPIASAAAVSASPPSVRLQTWSDASAAQTGPGAYRYRVEVPQLEGLALRSDVVDARIRGILQRQVSDFLAAAAAAPSASVLTCTSRTVRVTAKLVVLRVDCSSTQGGAARPNVWTQTFNCDLTAARILALQDLFRVGYAYLDVLSAAARAQVPAQATSVADRSLAAATAPVVNNFRAFLLDTEGLVIVLADVRADPRTADAAQVSIPYEQLERYLARGVTDLLTG